MCQRIFLVLDEAQVSQCSTCSAVTERKRYKCASCPKMLLCRACYSQVHELHPSHAFCVVPDKPVEVISNEDYLASDLPDPHEEVCEFDLIAISRNRTDVLQLSLIPASNVHSTLISNTLQSGSEPFTVQLSTRHRGSSFPLRDM